MDFRNKTAVITGAGSGIGRSVALAMAAEGVDIIVADINDKNAQTVKVEIEKLGRRAFCVHCDVSKTEEVNSLAKQSIEAFGKIDILVNNAGIGVYGKTELMSVAEYELITNINVLGVVRGAMAFMPHMIENGSGYIVNTGSRAGFFGAIEPYKFSKYGVIGYSEGLSDYLRPKGVMVSVLCPGMVHTSLLENATLVGNETQKAERKKYLEDFFYGPDALSPDSIAQTLLEGMKNKRFFIITGGTEQALAEAAERGHDINKLENYFKEKYKN